MMTTSTTFPGNPGSQTDSSDFAGSVKSAIGSANAPEAIQGVADGAHQTIDRLAEQVTPHVERMQQSVVDATRMLDERADQIRETADEWTETLRSTVRDNPLAAVGIAVALGMVLARLNR